jgi:glutamyl-Q tRNA(Asp) synthetase
MQKKQAYRGRFAPSPSGPLHFGSLVAAVGSYLQARHNGGEWLVRMEDIDPPREMAGAADSILRTLDEYGLSWDGEVLYQSSRSEAYLDTLDRLQREGLVYPCNCSRKEIMESARLGAYGPIYDGRCRGGRASLHRPHALRVQTHDHPISFVDLLLGHYEQRLESELGDFVVRRADNLFAYQLAVVVDDADQKITEVVRGCDLLDNTPRQIHLQQLLGLPTPGYLHLPLAVNSEGQKLSKQSGAESIEGKRPQQVLLQVLDFLGQEPPRDLVDSDLDSFWKWAIGNWRLERIPHGHRSVPSVQL